VVTPRAQARPRVSNRTALVGAVFNTVVTALAIPVGLRDDFSGPQLVFFFSSCAVLCTLSWVIFVMRARAIRANRSVGRRVDYQIVMLRQNLDSSKRLIREINAEFDLQVAAAEKIKAEAEQNQRLAELNADQARAVKNLIESVQDRASKIGGRQQWLFFLAGLLASVPLGVIGNFVFESVKAWLATH